MRTTIDPSYSLLRAQQLWWATCLPPLLNRGFALPWAYDHGAVQSWGLLLLQLPLEHGLAGALLGMKTHRVDLSSVPHCAHRTRAQGVLKSKVPPFTRSGNKVWGHNQGGWGWWVGRDRMQMLNWWLLARQRPIEPTLQEQGSEAELRVYGA